MTGREQELEGQLPPFGGVRKLRSGHPAGHHQIRHQQVDRRVAAADLQLDDPKIRTALNQYRD
jgi:hypothetical protein